MIELALNSLTSEKMESCQQCLNDSFGHRCIIAPQFDDYLLNRSNLCCICDPSRYSTFLIVLDISSS